MLFFATLVFLSVTLALLAVLAWLAPSRLARRVEAVAGGPSRVQWTARIVKLAGPFGGLMTPDETWDESALRIRFLQAGIRHPDARIAYFGLKGLLPLAFALLAFSALRASSTVPGVQMLFLVLSAALAGCYLPNLLLAMRVRSRRRELFNNFPDATDLMLVCVEAGMGLDAAIAKVAEEMRGKSPALAEELHLTLEMRAGAGREQALRNLALRTGLEEAGTFATMLTQADRFGTSIGDSLRVFSDDLRHKRQIDAEERAAKLPTKMLFPLVMFIFPSIIMIVLGPALIQLVRTILPMINR
jgi:tight adherence protein C